VTKTEFIESDIIERYVLGVATDDEIVLLNNMCKQYPEIKEEISSCEESLISYAESHGQVPPASVKLKLFEAINKSTNNSSAGEAKIIEHPSTPVQNRFKLFAVAASVLLMISLVVNFNLFHRLKDAHSQLAIIQNQKDILAQDIEYKKTSFQKAEENLQAVLNTSTQTVILKGVAAFPESKAIVYWNERTHTTHIFVSNLPVPPAGKQYQLWALANGKPVDAGVFEVGNNDTTLQQVKNIEAAQAFAVTLENKGGSVAPTLSAMYVIGNI